MRPVLDITGIELRRFLRQRSNIFFVFLFPLLLVILIGSQFGGEGPSGRVALVGADGALISQLSSELQKQNIEVVGGGAASVRDDLARGRIAVGIFLGADDQAAFDAGRPVDLDTVVSPQLNAQAVLEQVRTAVKRVASVRAESLALTQAGLSAAEAERALRQVGTAAVPRVQVTDADQVSQEFTGLGQLDLGASSQLLLFVFLSSLTGASTLILSRRQGVLRRMLAAPLTTGQALTGQALGRFALAMVQGVYLVLGTALLFDVNWGSWPATLSVLTAFALVSAATAMVIGSAMDNDGAAVGVGIGAGLVLAALGGCMVPLEFFPPTMRTLAHLTPHAWAYDAFADIQRRGGGVVDVLPQLGVLTLMAVLLLALGTWLLRRSLVRAL